MKISVITVAYNSGTTIERTIKSVLAQTYGDVEYIVVDGLSTDNTIDIIKRYEPLFGQRMRFISEKDLGIYDAMNKGVMMATGDVIGILNSDDRFTADDILEKVAAAFTADTDALYGDVHFVNAGRPDKCVRYYSGRIFRPWMVRYGFMPPHPSYYIRREVYEKYGLYSRHYKIAADFELIARLSYKENIRIKYLHLDMVTMQLGGASTYNWHSRIIGLKEDVVALRQLGIKTNALSVWMKFPIKLIESILIRK